MSARAASTAAGAARILALLALLCAALVVRPALAAFPPPPDGPVLDAANVIPDAEQAALDQRLRAYNQATGRSLVVATVPSLDGETIEMYAVKLFEEWGIGGEETDQGLLLLVAPNERKLRIEVGFGLHQYVTDALSGRIIRNIITPHFQQGDFAGGIAAGVDALVEQLNRDPADAQAIAEAARVAQAQENQPGSPSFLGIVFWIAMIGLFIYAFGRGGRGRRHRRGGIDPTLPVMIWGASALAHHMVGGRSAGFGGGGGFGDGLGGGGFGGFGGGMSGGGGASGSW